MDSIVFYLINNLATKIYYLDVLMIFITHFGTYVLALMVLLTKDKKVIFKSIILLAMTGVIGLIARQFYYSPRPNVELENYHLLVAPKDSSGMPSGHTVIAYSLALPLIGLKKWLSYMALILATLVGISRVYVGVHYPMQVLMGFLITFICYKIIDKTKIVDKITFFLEKFQ